MHNSLTALLTQVRDGSISVADAALQLREAPFEDLGYARVDHHRRLRQGAAEGIYGPIRCCARRASKKSRRSGRNATDEERKLHESGISQPLGQ